MWLIEVFSGSDSQRCARNILDVLFQATIRRFDDFFLSPIPRRVDSVIIRSIQ